MTEEDQEREQGARLATEYVEYLRETDPSKRAEMAYGFGWITQEQHDEVQRLIPQKEHTQEHASVTRAVIERIRDRHPRLLIRAALGFGAITRDKYDELLELIRRKEESERASVKAQLRVLHGP